jgi:hypothetical protein
MSRKQTARRALSRMSMEGHATSESSDGDEDRLTGHSHKQNGRNYVIDLRSFHKTKLRIETELRNSETTNDIMDTYCSDGIPYQEVNPLLSTDGTFPLIKFIYEHDNKGSIKTCWKENCRLTPAGEALVADIQGEGAEEVKSVQYGSETGTSLATPTQMHMHPAKAWRAIERFYNARSTELFDEGEWTKVKRRTKRWLRSSQRMYSTLVGRMPPDGLHIGESIEMSHGPLFYSTLLQRYGHTHAQCLATLLQIITNLKLLDPDPNTGKTETIVDYFDRATRIAREAREFPAMKVPIAGPLLKVMILQGLIRSNEAKYKHMVLTEYAQNLKSSIDELRATMQTVEGLREQDIIDQYAPTNLTETEVHLTAGRGPNDKCYLPGHQGHLCRNFTRTGKCRFGSNCRFKHDVKMAKAHLTEVIEETGNKIAEASMTISTISKRAPEYIIDNEASESTEEEQDF